MKKSIDKLVQHIDENPTDANAVIALLKINSDNIFYDYDLITKRHQERMRARKNKSNAN